jgi:hypothetical protein
VRFAWSLEFSLSFVLLAERQEPQAQNLKQQEEEQSSFFTFPIDNVNEP